MSYLRKVPATHDCDKPYPWSTGPGSIWRCDECGQLWRAMALGSRDGVAAFWRRLSRRRSRRYARRLPDEATT